MRFARRSATGLYVPMPDLTAYGIGKADQFDDTSKWQDTSSTSPFVATSSSLQTNGADQHTDFYWRKDFAAALADQYSQASYGGATHTGAGFLFCGGGLICRHTGASWAFVSGYYFLIEVTAFSGTPVYSWTMGRYSGSGTSVSRSVLTSGSWVGSPLGGVYKLTVAGTTPVLTIYENGSVLATTTDSSISPFLTGYPGFMGGTDAGSGSNFFSWGSWTGGPLNLVLPFIPTQRRGSGYYFGNQ